VACARGPRAVFARVAKHVAQGVPHLLRRSQDAVVVAVGEDGPDATPQSIQCARNADRQTLEAARKGGSRVALHDQVHVIRLHTEVNEPKPVALASRSNCATQSRELAQSAQRRQSGLHSHRHFDRNAVREKGASPVRDIRTFAAALGSGSLASTAPAVREHEPLVRGFRAPPSSSPHRSRLLGHCNPHHFNARVSLELRLNGHISEGIEQFPLRGIRAEQSSGFASCTRRDFGALNNNQRHAVRRSSRSKPPSATQLAHVRSCSPPSAAISSIERVDGSDARIDTHRARDA
jgi:hypothetical protein